MKIWDQIKAAIRMERLPAVSAKPEDGGFFTEGGGASRSNLEAIPAAYCAINLISGQLTGLPRSVTREQDGVQVPLENHPINALLRYPSRLVDTNQFWRHLIRGFVANGNAYAWIRRDFAGNKPIELVPAICVRTEWIEARNAPYQRYQLRLMGSQGRMAYSRQIEANSRDVITLHGPGYDGLWAPSPIQFAARNTLEMLRVTMLHQKNMVGRGVNVGTALAPREDSLTKPEDWKKALAMLRETYSGAEATGTIPFLPPGIEVQKLQSLSSVDLQLVDLLKWGVEDIARVWNISPVRLGHYHTGMRARTFEAQAVDFERYTITDLAKAIDAQFARKLLSTEDRIERINLSTDTSSVGMGTLLERITAAETAVSRGGIWTVNEGRRLTGLIARDDGDRLLQPKGAPEQDDGKKKQLRRQ